jgi:hypothetical protein
MKPKNTKVVWDHISARLAKDARMTWENIDERMM